MTASSAEIVKVALVYREYAINKSNAHFRRATSFSRWHLGLGVPAVVFSAAAGTTLFSTSGTSSPAATVVLPAAVVAFVASVLAAVQTFLKLGEETERHRRAAADYEKIRSGLDLFQLQQAMSDTKSPTDAVKELKAFVLEFNEVSARSPLLPASVFDKIPEPDPALLEIAAQPAIGAAGGHDAAR